MEVFGSRFGVYWSLWLKERWAMNRGAPGSGRSTVGPGRVYVHRSAHVGTTRGPWSLAALGRVRGTFFARHSSAMRAISRFPTRK